MGGSNSISKSYCNLCLLTGKYLNAKEILSRLDQNNMYENSY